MNRNKIGERLKLFRNQLKLTQGKFAEPLGISGAYISDIEKGKSAISNPIFILLEIKYRLNRNWLETGEGDPYIMATYINKDKPLEAADESGLFGQTEFREFFGKRYAITKFGRFNEDSPIDLYKDLLGKTIEVLASSTHYAKSLESNINSFYDAIQTEKVMKDENIKNIEELKKKYKNLINRMEDIERNIQKLQGSEGGDKESINKKAM